MSGFQNDKVTIINNSGPSVPAKGNFGMTTGTGAAYTLEIPNAITGYKAGFSIQVMFHTSNAEAPTIAINGLTAVQIKIINFDELVNPVDNQLKPNIIYELVFDGGNFQVLNAVQPIVNTSEFFQNKGLLDASTFPPFPAGKKGDAYTISATGLIGDGDSSEGLQVGEHDLLYCLQDNDGGFNSAVGQHWSVLQAKLLQASWEVTGITRAATHEQTAEGDVIGAFVSPATLRGFFQSRWRPISDLRPTPVNPVPQATRGRVFRMSQRGLLGRGLGSDGLLLEEGDYLVCTNDSPQGAWDAVKDNWLHLDAKLGDLIQHLIGY